MNKSNNSYQNRVINERMRRYLPNRVQEANEQLKRAAGYYGGRFYAVKRRLPDVTDTNEGNFCGH